MRVRARKSRSRGLATGGVVKGSERVLREWRGKIGLLKEREVELSDGGAGGFIRLEGQVVALNGGIGAFRNRLCAMARQKA